jgi:hypothetical protein
LLCSSFPKQQRVIFVDVHLHRCSQVALSVVALDTTIIVVNMCLLYKLIFGAVSRSGHRDAGGDGAAQEVSDLWAGDVGVRVDEAIGEQVVHSAGLEGVRPVDVEQFPG